MTSSSQFYIKLLVQRPDSLYPMLHSSDEQVHLKAYNGLAFYHSLSDADSAMFYAEKALLLSEKLDNDLEKGSALRNMGNTYALNGDYSQALQNLMKALDIFEKEGEKRKIMEVYIGLCKLNYDLEDYETSLEYGKKFIALYQGEKAKGNTLASPYEYALLIGFLGGTPREAGNYPLAEAYFKEYLALSRNLEVPDDIHTVLVKSLAETFQSAGQYDSALKYTCLAREFLPGNAGIPSGLQTGYEGSIGNILLLMGRSDEALPYIKHSYFGNKSTGTYYYASHDARRLGYIYLAKQLYDSAGYWFNAGRDDLDSLKDMISRKQSETNQPEVFTGYQLVMTLNQTEILQRYYLSMVLIQKALAGLYKKTGDLDLAITHFEWMDLYKDSLNDIKDNIEERKLQVRFANDQMSQQIELVQKENDLKQTRLKNTRLVLFGMVAAGVLFSGIMFILFRQRRIREVQDKIMLEQRLMRSQMNPHFIFNSLASVQNFIVRQDDKNASIYLSRFSDLVRSILNHSREESITLEEEISTIENYLSLQKIRFPDKFDYTLDIDIGIDTETVMVPPMLAQPFIENAIEHGIRHKAGKGKIEIRIRHSNNRTIEQSNNRTIEQLIFEVEDDGIGRQKAQEILKKQNKDHKSLATIITRERIAALNRKSKKKITLEIIDLTDDLGQASGTLVRFVIPLA